MRTLQLLRERSLICCLRIEQLKVWRLKQEKKLKMKSGTKKNSKIMNEREVETFMMTYQRITQNGGSVMEH